MSFFMQIDFSTIGFEHRFSGGDSGKNSKRTIVDGCVKVSVGSYGDSLIAKLIMELSVLGLFKKAHNNLEEI